jgi:hypothetical protein
MEINRTLSFLDFGDHIAAISLSNSPGPDSSPDLLLIDEVVKRISFQGIALSFDLFIRIGSR